MKNKLLLGAILISNIASSQNLSSVSELNSSNTTYDRIQNNVQQLGFNTILMPQYIKNKELCQDLLKIRNLENYLFVESGNVSKELYSIENLKYQVREVISEPNYLRDAFVNFLVTVNIFEKDGIYQIEVLESDSLTPGTDINKTNPFSQTTMHLEFNGDRDNLAEFYDTNVRLSSANNYIMGFNTAINRYIENKGCFNLSLFPLTK